MIAKGSRVRLLVPLGALPRDHVCKVLVTFDCGGNEAASMDIEGYVSGVGYRYTVWHSEVEEVSPS